MTTADTIIAAARVHTVGGGAGDADAVAIADGRIAGIGRLDDLQSLAGAETRVLEFEGATIMPGLSDSHMHPVYSLQVARGTSLVGATTYDALRQALERARDEHAGEQWCFAWGLAPNAFEGRPMTNEILHEVFGPDRPV